jgi:hypothetical protein
LADVSLPFEATSSAGAAGLSSYGPEALSSSIPDNPMLVFTRRLNANLFGITMCAYANTMILPRLFVNKDG